MNLFSRFRNPVKPDPLLRTAEGLVGAVPPSPQLPCNLPKRNDCRVKVWNINRSGEIAAQMTYGNSITLTTLPFLS